MKNWRQIDGKVMVKCVKWRQFEGQVLKKWIPCHVIFLIGLFTAIFWAKNLFFDIDSFFDKNYNEKIEFGKPQHGKYTYKQYNPKDLQIILIFHGNSWITSMGMAVYAVFF